MSIVTLHLPEHFYLRITLHVNSHAQYIGIHCDLMWYSRTGLRFCDLRSEETKSLKTKCLG
jgi:hypothetical protein